MAQPSERSRIDKLIAHHEEQLHALRIVRALLVAGEQASSTKRGKTTVQRALQLEVARRSNGHESPEHGPYYVPEGDAEAVSTPQVKPKGYGSKAAIAARRQKTAALLATFSRTVPAAHQDPARRGFGGLIAAGYLKRGKGGFLRTAKVFTP